MPWRPPSSWLPLVRFVVVLAACSFPGGWAGAVAQMGSEAVAGPVTTTPVPQNPYLAANGRGFVHDDSYQSDTYQWHGPIAAPTDVRPLMRGGMCMPPLTESTGRLVVVCKEVPGPRLHLVDPASMQPVASTGLPANSNGSLPVSYGYGYLDPQDRFVVGGPSRQILIIQITSGSAPGFSLAQVLDLRPYLASTDRLFSVLPDWEGRIWFATTGGVVGWIDPITNAVATLSFSEPISNSFAVDETGGVFVVTDHALYRLDPAPENAPPVITWRETYDRGNRVKPGQASQGSGTSPTLMGSGFVAIADNADPRLHALVFRREKVIGGPRLACSVALFPKRKGAAENSFIGTDTSFVIENNYGYRGPQSVTGGASTVPGVARVDLNPATGACAVKWLVAERVPPIACKLSLANGLVYLYTKDPDPEGSDPWKLTAVDFETGQVVYRQLAGMGSDYNGHYNAITLAPDGAAYVGVDGGLVQLREAA